MSNKRQATSLIVFRCKPDEMAALKSAAISSELSMSAFVRKAAFKAASMTASTYDARQPKVASIDTALILGELGRIGNNINQIAKACNSNSSYASFIDSASLLSELQAIRALLLKGVQ